jgi:hypothetical protein
MLMDREETLAMIAAARALVQAVAQDTESPLVAQAMRFAEQNLHWAAWNLGEFTSLAPELEASAPTGE